MKNLILNPNGRALFNIASTFAVFFTIRTVLEGIKYSSQIALAGALIIATLVMSLQGVSWKEYGLSKPKSYLKAFLLFIFCVLTIGLVFNFIVQPLFPTGVNDINHGTSLSFNEMLFQLFVIGLLGAALGEELLFRGFFLNQLNNLFGKNWIGNGLSLLIQAFVFGVLHSGLQGVVSAGVIGVILGIFYLASGRNLWVVIAAHAVPDIISIASSYQIQ